MSWKCYLNNFVYQGDRSNIHGGCKAEVKKQYQHTQSFYVEK